MAKGKAPRSVVFAEPNLQNGQRLAPGVPLAFEAAGAAEFFIACGWAEASDQEPVLTYTADEVPLAEDARLPSGRLAVNDSISDGAA